MRQKTVFSTREVAHVWANQNQAVGRNASGSLFFEGVEIWSYGRHYLAGKIHRAKTGRRFALVNDFI